MSWADKAKSSQRLWLAVDSPPPGNVGTFTPQRAPYGGVPDALILAGAAVGLATTTVMVFVMVIQFVVFQQIFAEDALPPGFPSMVVLFPIAFGVLGILGLVGSVLAFKARSELKRTDGRSGSTKAIVAAVLLMVGMGMLGGVLVIVGAVLAQQQATRS